MYFDRVYLAGMYLDGVYFDRVYLAGVYLDGVYFDRVYLATWLGCILMGVL